jgi:hypothetical protein
MWVFTPQGFYSVVVHRDDPSLVLVRARAREDLENLQTQLPGLVIFEDAAADYLYRAIVKREDWKRALAELADAMDYDNFKDAVTERQGEERHRLYLRVWGVMLALQPKRWSDFGFGNGQTTLPLDDGDHLWGDLRAWDEPGAVPEHEGGLPLVRRARRRRARNGSKGKGKGKS